MAPALTKVLKDGHGTHLSLPAGSVISDPNGRLFHTELDPLLMLTEDTDLQKMWLNVSLFGTLDFCMSPLDVPANPVLSPCLQASVSQYEPVSSLSPPGLLSFLPLNKDLSDSHQGASVLPGVADMLLGLIPEHNSQEACLQQGCADAPECGPDGFDVHHSSLTNAGVFPEYSPGEFKSQGYTHIFATLPTVTQEKEVAMGYPSASEQRCTARLNTDPLASRAAQEDALKAQLSRQAGLRSRAQRLQKRLQSVLAEHSLLHCNQQLEGLKRHCLHEDLSLDSLDTIYPGLLPQQGGSKPNCSSLVELSTDTSSLADLKEFSCSSHTVLKSLLESLDSDATASSSSDEELEEHKDYSRTKRTLPVGRSCERQWLEERAELGSRWTWLQLRLAELEGRIQQLVELHDRIRSSKGGVVLAVPQALTDRKIQQNLRRKMGGLSCTAADVDAEPCSPTRLLHNIERQSAQLSQIVNSLMPPLSFSPLSKQAQAWKERSTFDSGQKADNAVTPGSSKRRKLWSRRLFKADVSCVCARTRPLVSYCKPRLFKFSTQNPSSPQDSRQITSSSSTFFLPSSCLCCSSCDPVVLCSSPDCCSSWTPSSRNPCPNSPPVLPLSCGMAPSFHIQRSMAREEWSQRPLVINNHSPTPSHYNRCSSTPLHNSHKYRQHTGHHKIKVMGLSPIRRVGSAPIHSRRSKQRKRKRKHIIQHMKDEEDSLYQLCDLQESSDDLLEESYTQALLKQASQGFVRKRQGESAYNINNVVIPMSLAKVEKLQYKDILTPSWRKVDSYTLAESKAQKRQDCEEGQVEDLIDEVFAQRHLASEQKEKLRWSYWGKRKRCRRPTRSGSRLSGSGGTMCTSGEESSVEWSSAQLDTDEQPSSEEWLPQAPWELRVFPLDSDEEEALLSHNLQAIPAEFSDSITCDAIAHSFGFRSPSGEQSWCTTSSVS